MDPYSLHLIRVHAVHMSADTNYEALDDLKVFIGKLETWEKQFQQAEKLEPVE